MTADFRLHLVTWNVGESDPPKDLSSLLDLDEKELPDLYAIGLQELRSDTTTLITDSIFDDPWTNVITGSLSQRGYVRIKSLRLVGIHLSVYIKRSQLLNISGVESEFTRTGFGGLWGSKGGVSIRFDIYGVNLCFINSHFSAHNENYAQRIEDYNQVLLTQKFRDVNCPNILDNDYVFWLGDLNFRLNDVSNDEARTSIREGKYQELLSHDQLNIARKNNLIFVNFEEGQVSFPPTYKFDFNTNQYDTSSKNRVPAWCDRILWRVHSDAFKGTTLTVKQHKYISLSDYKNSDHKPVVASFTIKVLGEAPALPVMFEPLSSWVRGKDQKVVYSISMNFLTTSRDWIGLYPVNFKNFEEYSTYIWVPTNGEDNQDGTYLYTAVFEERDLYRLKSGYYRLLYFSAVKNYVVGYSDEIELLDFSHTTSSEDERILVRPGEADVDEPAMVHRFAPDVQPPCPRPVKKSIYVPSKDADKESSLLKPISSDHILKEDQKTSTNKEGKKESMVPAVQVLAKEISSVNIPVSNMDTVENSSTEQENKSMSKQLDLQEESKIETPISENYELKAKDESGGMDQVLDTNNGIIASKENQLIDHEEVQPPEVVSKDRILSEVDEFSFATDKKSSELNIRRGANLAESLPAGEPLIHDQMKSIKQELKDEMHKDSQCQSGEDADIGKHEGLRIERKIEKVEVEGIFKAPLLSFEEFSGKVEEAIHNGEIKEFTASTCDLPECLEPLTPRTEKGLRSSDEKYPAEDGEEINQLKREDNEPQKELEEGSNKVEESISENLILTSKESDKPIRSICEVEESQGRLPTRVSFEENVRITDFEKDKPEEATSQKVFKEMYKLPVQLVEIQDVIKGENALLNKGLVEEEQHDLEDDSLEKNVISFGTEQHGHEIEKAFKLEQHLLPRGLIQIEEQQKQNVKDDTDTLDAKVQILHKTMILNIQQEKIADRDLNSSDTSAELQNRFVSKIPATNEKEISSNIEQVESPDKKSDSDKDESESQTHSNSSDFEIVQPPTRHSTLESFEDSYLSLREDVLALKDNSGESAEKPNIQSVLLSSADEVKDPNLIESINAQLLEQNISNLAECFGEIEEVSSVLDAANVELEQQTKSSAPGDKTQGEKEEEKCIVVKETVVFEKEDSTNKSDAKVATDNQGQLGTLKVDDRLSKFGSEKVEEFVNNVVATAVKEAVTSCAVLTENMQDGLKECGQSQDPAVDMETLHYSDADDKNIEPSKVEKENVTMKQNQHLEETPHSHQLVHPSGKLGDDTDETKIDQHFEKQQDSPQLQLQPEIQKLSQDLENQTIEDAKVESLPGKHIPLSVLDIQSELPLKLLEKNEAVISNQKEVSEDLPASNHPTYEGRDGSSNFFDAYMNLRDKAMSEKLNEDKMGNADASRVFPGTVKEKTLSNVDKDLIEKNLHDLSEDMGLKMDEPKVANKSEEVDGEYVPKKEAELLVKDLDTKSLTLMGSSLQKKVEAEVKEDILDISKKIESSDISDLMQLENPNEILDLPHKGMSSENPIFQASIDPSLEKTELYQMKPSELKEEIHDVTQH